MRLLVMVVALLTLAGCGKPLFRAPQIAPELPFPQPRNSGDIMEITLSRTGCLGECPIYRLELRRDGMSQYVGEQFTPIVGTYEAITDSGDFTRLAQLLIDTRFFSAAEEPLSAVDAPHVIIGALVEGGRKTITDAFRGRSSDFINVATTIEAVAGAWVWRATRAPPS